MADDIGLTAVLVLSIVFVVWFFVGGAWNRRLARRLANEMKGAVLALGGTSKVQWRGSTAFRMTTEGSEPPFRYASVIVALRPREMPINWAWGVAAGRTDVAVFEASLRTSPRLAFEIVDPRTPVGRRRARSGSRWSRRLVGGRPFLLKAEDAEGAVEFLEGLDSGKALRGVAALEVAAGDEPRIAASLVAVPGETRERIEALRTLAAAISAQ